MWPSVSAAAILLHLALSRRVVSIQLLLVHLHMYLHKQAVFSKAHLQAEPPLPPRHDWLCQVVPSIVSLHHPTKHQVTLLKVKHATTLVSNAVSIVVDHPIGLHAIITSGSCVHAPLVLCVMIINKVKYIIHIAKTFFFHAANANAPMVK